MAPSVKEARTKKNLRIKRLRKIRPPWRAQLSWREPTEFCWVFGELRFKAELVGTRLMTARCKAPMRPEGFTADVERGLRKAAKTAREVARISIHLFITGRTARLLSRSGSGLLPKGVIVFIVSGSSHAHTFSMSQGPEDDLLPWVAGGVLLIAMTIAVAAVAGSSGDQVLPAAAQGSDQHAMDSLSDPTKGTIPPPGQ